MLDLENAVVIANPRAGGGRVGRQWHRIMALLAEVLGPVPVWRTEHPGHARLLASEALWQGKDVILSLGGDGTHHEVVGGVVRDRPRPGAITVGVLPVGTGGDFRRMIEGSGDLREQAERLLEDTPHPIDVGVLTYETAVGERAERVFLNEASLGISGLVVQHVSEFHKRLGSASYFVMGMRALATYPSAFVRLSVDGIDVGEFELGTVLIANGQWAGGGMHFAPEAVLDDGMLDVTVIQRRSLPQMMSLTPRLYLGGIRHAENVVCFRGIHVSVTPVLGAKPPVEADGEALGVAPVDATVLGGAIRMIGVRGNALEGAMTPAGSRRRKP